MQVLHKIIYSDWNIATALLISIRFLFDVLVFTKSGQYVVKAVQINSSKCSFVRVAWFFNIANFIMENNSS